MPKTRRIVLDERASKVLGSIVLDLKSSEPHLKITASKAASWIVAHFIEHYFARSRSKMVDAHRDRKAHLKGLIERLHSDGDPSAVSELKSALREWEKKKAGSLIEDNDVSENRRPDPASHS